MQEESLQFEVLCEISSVQMTPTVPTPAFGLPFGNPRVRSEATIACWEKFCAMLPAATMVVSPVRMYISFPENLKAAEALKIGAVLFQPVP